MNRGLIMIYFLALIPATMLTIAGYFVSYLSHRSEGGFRTFGKYLGFWAFTLAGLVILGAIFAAAHGRHHGGPGMQGRMQGPWPGDPRFFGPRMEGPPDADRPDESQRGHAPKAPPDGANPTAPPAPGSASPR
jgi:hypothetical protein